MAARLSPENPSSVSASRLNPAATGEALHVLSVSPHGPLTSARNAIDQTMTPMRANDAQATEAAEQLQERLRLGARMLKAFQSQIGQVESAIERANVRQREVQAAGELVDQRIASLASRLESSMAAFTARTDEIAAKALRQHEDQFIARERALTDMEGRISAMAARADVLSHTLEHASTAAAQTARESAAAAERIEAGAARMSQMQAAYESQRQSLSSEIHQMTLGLDRAAQRGAQIAESAQAAIHASGAAADDIRAQLEELHQGAELVNVAGRRIQAIEHLLDRLAPWEAVILRSHGPADGLPEPVARLIDDLREGITRDLAGVSTAMIEATNRIARLGVPSRLQQSELLSVRSIENDDDAPLHDAEIVTLPIKPRSVVEPRLPLRFPMRTGNA